MASQSRKYRGFSTERVVAEYLSTWWAHADIGRGAGKDITHVPFDMEVKATCRLNGQGEKSPEDYLAFMRLGDLVDLLLKAGYGDFKGDRDTLEPMRCKMCGAWAFTETCKTCEVDLDANL